MAEEEEEEDMDGVVEEDADTADDGEGRLRSFPRMLVAFSANRNPNFLPFPPPPSVFPRLPLLDRPRLFDLLLSLLARLPLLAFASLLACLLSFDVVVIVVVVVVGVSDAGTSDLYPESVDSSLTLEGLTWPAASGNY